MSKRSEDSCHAPRSSHFRRIDPVRFGAAIRPGLDRVRQPQRLLQRQSSRRAVGGRDRLHDGIRGRAPGPSAHLGRRREPVLGDRGRLHRRRAHPHRAGKELPARCSHRLLGRVVHWRGLLDRRRPRRHGLRDVAVSPARRPADVLRLELRGPRRGPSPPTHQCRPVPDVRGHLHARGPAVRPRGHRATAPPRRPGPELFQQSLRFLDADGNPIRYEHVYVNGFPPPPRIR